MPIPGLLLAGGRGRRMQGRDKPFVEIAGRTLLDRALARFAPQVAPLAISGNGDLARFSASGFPVIADADSAFSGPLAGILAGLRWAADAVPGAPLLAAAAVDAPFLPLDLVTRLAKSAGARTVVVARSSSGVHAVFALWPITLADDLDAFLAGGGRRVSDFADRHLRLNVPFEDIIVAGDGLDPFFNVNTPEDAGRASQIAALLDRA